MRNKHAQRISWCTPSSSLPLVHPSFTVRFIFDGSELTNRLLNKFFIQYNIFKVTNLSFTNINYFFYTTATHHPNSLSISLLPPPFTSLLLANSSSSFSLPTSTQIFHSKNLIKAAGKKI